MKSTIQNIFRNLLHPSFSKSQHLSFKLLFSFLIIGQTLFAQNLNIGSNTVLPKTVCAGILDIPIHSFVINGTGNITAISFFTTGSTTVNTPDISNFKLYKTSTSTFSASNLISQIPFNPANPKTFTGFNIPFSGSTTEYFWITMDLLSSANSTRIITVAATTTTDITPNAISGGSSASGTQTISKIPATPGPIGTYSGPVCSGTTFNLGVSSVTDATSYTWISSAIDWTFTPPSISNGVTVNAGNPGTSAIISVRAENSSCGPSPFQTIAVQARSLANNAGTINPPSTPSTCPKTNETYSISLVNNAAYYIWTVPSGWTPSGPITTLVPSVTVQSGNFLQDGNITVTAYNSCNVASATSTLAVTVPPPVPNTPGAITGAVTQCQGTNQTYSITAVPNATTYNWTTPLGWTITAGSGTNSITTTSGSSGGNITVNAGNACGTSAVGSPLNVTVNPLPATVGSIGGPAIVCEGTNQTYSISTVANATSYLWTIPPGWIINSGQGTISINVRIGTAGGSVSVKAINTCGETTNSRTINVTLNAGLTLTSGSTSNNQSFCINTALTTITYSITGGATNATVTGLPVGVTALYNTGELTLSGTPTSSGTFNYTVNTTGTCVQATASGIITVTANAAINLTSGAASNNQTICINNAITNIRYSVTGGATNASVNGLPTGVTANFSSGVLTISGTPSVAGIFNYQVSTSGTCVQTTASGTIVVNADAALSLTSGAGTNMQTLCLNSAITAITYLVAGGATNATVAGLPSGVTGSFNSGVLTISGSPSVAGTFNYIVTTTGNCIQTNATGTIGVNTFPPVGNPTPITGNPPTCQLTNGTTTTTFSTTAANNQGFIWTTNNPAAGTINSASGVMTWANGFAGSVNIQVAASGCNSTTQQVVRPVTITPTVGTPTAITVSSGTEPTCQVSNSSTLTIYRTTATDNTGFNWSVSNFAAGAINPGSGVMTWINGFSGSVDIQVTANGCNGPSSQVIRMVNVTPANFTVTNSPLSQAICAGSTSSLVALSANVANTTYTWTASATFGVAGFISNGTGTIPAQTINSLGNKIDSVTYFITPSANGCTGPVTRYVISILPIPKVSMLVSPSRSCAPAVISFNNTTRFANIWEWYLNGSLFSIDSMPNGLVISDTGNHVIKLVASNTLGCGRDSVEKTVLVTKAPRLPMVYPRINAVKGFPTQLNAMSGGLIYSWKPATGLDNPNIKNPIGFYTALLDSVIYFVTITDSSGCVITDKQVVWIYAKPGIHMPTAFTPNFDGINDLFKPVVSSNIRIKYLRIFDRWGKLIFETIDINQGWDGTVNGKPMPMSTYAWVISGIDNYGNELIQKGNVTLIRN